MLSKKLLLTFILVSSVSCAQINLIKTFNDPDGKEIQFYRTHQQGSFASTDSLMHNGKSFFNSEGSSIERIVYEDFNNNGTKELLLQTFPGGSGGYREYHFFIFNRGSFKKIWNSEPLKHGQIKIESSDEDSPKIIKIEYQKEVKPLHFEKAIKKLFLRGKKIKELR